MAYAESRNNLLPFMRFGVVEVVVEVLGPVCRAVELQIPHGLEETARLAAG
jgi:hypothetical protein